MLGILALQRVYIFLLLLLVVCGVIIPIPTYATAYSIPINGRFATPKINLKIPGTPKWAHDVVVNASLAWNNGQLWFQRTYFPDGNVYTFTESDPANATVNYAMPSVCANVAVGWTDYTFAPSSRIITSARTYLDPKVFNATQENNATARQYAFRLALHEFGRVLGLGSVIDGKDIMDPLATPDRATQPPMISTLDLYAVHVLASENSVRSVIVLDTDQYQLLNASLLTTTNSLVSSLGSSARHLVDRDTPRISGVGDIFKLDHYQGPAHRSIMIIGYLTILAIVLCACLSFGISLYHSRRWGHEAYHANQG